jgi:CRP-like cAMP-binding protein
MSASSGAHDMAGKSGRESFDPQNFLAKVGAGKTISSYQKDQVIFSQGEAADAVFYVQKGRVKVVVLSDQGKEAVVGILEAGQFFGEGCLNGHDLRIATTTAMEECLLTAIGKSTMIAVLHNEPKFSELFVAYLLKRNSRIEEDLIDQLFNSSEKASGPTTSPVGEFRQGRQSDPDQAEYQSRDAGRNDRHDTLAGELFHEQVSEARFHQLQRKNRSPSFAVECGSLRKAKFGTRLANGFKPGVELSLVYCPGRA